MPLQSVGGTHVPGFAPQRRGLFDMNQIYMMMKLLEQHQVNKEKEEARQVSIQNRLQDISKKREEAKDLGFSKLVGAATGADPRTDPSVLPFMTGARNKYEELFVPGTRPMPLRGIPTQTEADLEVTPGPPIINKPQFATPREVVEQAATGVEAMRSDALAKLKSAGLGPGTVDEEGRDIGVYDWVQGSRVPPTPKELDTITKNVLGYRKEITGIKKEQQATIQARKLAPFQERKAEAEARKLETEAKVGEYTEPDQIWKAQNDADYAAARARSAEVDALYADIFAKGKMKLNELDAVLKSGQIENLPLERERIRAEIANRQAQGMKLAREAAVHSRIMALADQYNSREAQHDPQLQRALLQRIMLEKGDINSVAAMNDRQLKAAAESNVQATRMAIKLGEEITLGDPKRTESLKGLIRGHALSVAQGARAAGNGDSTRIPIYSVGNVGNSQVSTTVNMPLADVEAWALGRDIARASQRVPDVVMQKDHPLNMPEKDQQAAQIKEIFIMGKALATKVSIDYAYAKDLKTYADAINSYDDKVIDPRVKAAAMQILLGTPKAEQQKEEEKKPGILRSIIPKETTEWLSGVPGEMADFLNKSVNPWSR